MVTYRIDLSALVLLQLIFLLATITNCDVLRNAKDVRKQVATIRVVGKNLTNNGTSEISSDVYEAFASSASSRPNKLGDKITGKLIYAKTYDQALLDKILNKSDTYYKKCECVLAIDGGRALAASAFFGQVVIAFVDHPSNQCTVDDMVKQCAGSLNASVLLLNHFSDSNTSKSSSSLNLQLDGYPIEVIVIQNSIGEALVNLLKTTSSEIIASIEAKLASGSSQNSSSTKSTSDHHPMATSSILAIVFGILVIIILLVGLFGVFVCIQKSKMREDQEKLEELIDKIFKRALSRMKCSVLKETDKEVQNKEMCVICMDNYTPKEIIRVLPCLHYFHKQEIDTWLRQNHTCPVCKINVLEADILNYKLNTWEKLLVRFKLAKSPLQLQQALQRYRTYRRHHSMDDRYSAINQNTITTVVSTEEQRSRVFSEFVNLHQNRYSIDMLNNQLENDDWRKDRPKRIRRLNFFGETLEDFEYNDDLDDPISPPILPIDAENPLNLSAAVEEQQIEPPSQAEVAEEPMDIVVVEPLEKSIEKGQEDDDEVLSPDMIEAHHRPSQSK